VGRDESRRSPAGGLPVVVVGGLGGLLELVVGLIEEVLSFGGVAVHVPFVGLLGGSDLLPGLRAEALGCGEIRVTVRVDVVLRHLSADDASDHESTGKRESAEDGLLLRSFLRE
jgi:hypothetical protein